MLLYLLFQYQQNKLDQHLLGNGQDINFGGIVLHPYGVTREMEEQVKLNLELINTFEKNLSSFDGHGSIKILLGHFQELFEMVQMNLFFQY